jgi:hypothetical protein
MANKKELVTVLTVKTDESQNTIKGLKKEIADLKKQYDSAVIGSEEFERVSKELATAQANLKTVMADGKKTTDAVEGSYNHLTATMAELKKEWKATADEVKRNELAQQIDAINTELKDMDASIGNFQRNVGDYANSFKDALETQQKSTEKVRIGLDGLQKTASGLASGYAAVQGTLNLLNIESTQFEQAMIKVQSAMAIAQGIGGMKDLIEGGGTLITVFRNAATGVKTFIKSLSGVKAAIAATGIGVLVVAVGTLVAYWDDLMGLIRKDKGEIEKLKTDFEDLKANVKAKDEDFEFFIKLQEAAGKSREEILKAREEFTSLKYEQLNATYNEKADSLINHETGFWGNLFGDKKREELQSQVDEAKALRDEAYQAWQAASNAITLYNTEQETKGREDAAAAAQSKLEQAKDIAERARQATIDTKMEELAELKRIYEEEKLLLEQHGIDTANLTEVYNQKVKEINDKYKTEGGVLDGLSNPFGESPDPYDTARQQMEQWIADRNAGIVREKEMEMEKIEWMRQNYGDLFAFIQQRGGDSAGLVAAGFMESLYTASAIIGAIQDGIDTTTKEGFERNKKLQIANAIIQTLVGVTTALSGAFTTKTGPWDIALAAIQASTIAATGAIQVANIRKQTFNGGNEGDLGGAAATPNINIADSMPIQYTRDLLSDTEMTNLNKEQRVYVLESDITDTQDNVKVKESNSSF